jgi:hypothetical protein
LPAQLGTHTQLPEMQLVDALQAFPQEPQFRSLFASWTSQPSAAS